MQTDARPFLTLDFAPTSRYRIATIMSVVNCNDSAKHRKAWRAFIQARKGDDLAPIVAALSSHAREHLLPILAAEGVAC